jgi:Mn-dependent DtxR family transcriptional regulator
MSLSPIKLEILETMLLNGKPIKAAQIASENKKEFPSTMMHLLGLVKIGYVNSPQKGLYIVTNEGKKALESSQSLKRLLKRYLLMHRTTKPSISTLK